MNDELDLLIAKVCDGRSDEAERARLTELLRRDTAARDEYLRQVDLHAALADEALPTLETNLINYPIRQFTRARGNSGLLLQWAAAFALLIGISALLLPRPGSDSPGIAKAILPPAAATLLFAEQCEWAAPGPAEGQRLAPGRLNLISGMAVLRLDGGAEIVITGPVELELESAASARLHHGDILIRATDGAEGFVLHTPTSEVVDLGTEFAVKVAAGGATEVHVLEGEVVCRTEGADEPGNILAAGTALRFEAAKASPQSVGLDATRFADVIRNAKPRERPDLMTVYEGFYYEAGSYSPGEIVKGKGWAGPWRLRQAAELRGHGEIDSTTDMRIVHGQLNVVWPVPGGRLGMLEMPPGRSYRVRPMKQSIDLARDGVTYFSLMSHEPDHPLRPKGRRPQESVRLTFRSTDDYWGEALSFGLSSTLRPVVNNGRGVWTQSASGIPEEQSLLWVGKIVSRRDGEDEVSFRIYGQADPLDFVEPGAWHVATRGLRMNARLDLVLLTSHGDSPRIVDELRIGPTWRSVVPIRKQIAADLR